MDDATPQTRRRRRAVITPLVRVGLLAGTALGSTLLVVAGAGPIVALAIPAIPAVALLRFRPRAAAASLGGTAVAALVLVIIGGRTPGNDRVWERSVARAPSVSVVGSVLTVRDLRDFSWDADGVATECWTDRSYDVANLRGVDLIVEPFNLSGLMAHTMLSFDFGDDGRLLLSIEARKEEGERYGAFRGGLNAFELIYVLATEEDALTLRARKGYELIAYPTETDPLWLRAFLLSLAAEANILRAHPRVYHTTSDNCTSARIRRADALNPARFGVQLRMLFPGLLDRLLADRGILAIRTPIGDAREAYRIDDAVLEHAGDPAFSELIRAGRP